MAASLGKPLVQGAVHGETWTAFVRGYDLRDPEVACPACAFGPAEWNRLGSRFGCDPMTARAQGTEPTQTLPTVCGTAAQLASSEVFKWLVGLEQQALCAEELAYCLRSHRSWRTALPRNPQCRCPHRRWNWVDVQENPAALSVSSLVRTLGLVVSSDGSTPKVRGELPWISFVICAACGRQNWIHRFAQAGVPVGACACGQTLLAGPPGMQSVLPASDLRSCCDEPLDTLGLKAGGAVGLSQGEGDWTYFQIGSLG
jgi:hypothetical protein